MVMPFLQPGVEVCQLHSHILNQGMQLYIKLPWSYESSDTTYPVLFCLDANRFFPLYSTMSFIYETPGFNAQEIVIVGIGYQVDEDRLKGLAQWSAWRTRDLTPERSEKIDAYWQASLSPLMGGEEIRVQSGGAYHFLRAIEEEIIPFIETNYRASSTERGLAGYSFSGLFTLYTLLTGTQLFTRYFAGSPIMLDELFEYEENYASTHSDMKARLLLTAGSNESDLLEPLRRMAACLQSRMYPGLEVLTHVFEDEGHISAGAASVSRALRALYYEVGRRD
ncbi:MAG: alpha/beta hydrolase-fold protein [Brevefilum sp.]|nr:alpha/beta hydrolase-fold protein [Brevefilum sp.]